MFYLKLFQIIHERIHARHRHGVIKRGAHAAGNAVALEIQQAAAPLMNSLSSASSPVRNVTFISEREPGCAQG